MSSYIDLILAIFLFYSAYQGYKVGFIAAFHRVLFLLFCILLSLYLALQFKGIIYPGLIASPYIAMAVLALLFAILFRYLLKKALVFLNGALQRFDLMWLNPVLGALLGIMKAYIIVFIVISVIGSFGNRTLLKPFLNSDLSAHMYNQVRVLTGFNLMKYLKDLSIKETFQKVQKEVDHTVQKIESQSS